MALKDVKKLPVDPNGHMLGDTEADVFYYGVGKSAHPQVMGLYYGCRMCDKGRDHRVEGDTIRIQTPCPLPEGITTVITLKVPSGKIVVADDLRPVYDGFDHDGLASYNSALGQHQVIEAMAAEGCAYGPVGNSCPGLWRTGEDTYEIVSGVWDEEWADEDDEPPASPRKPEDKLASICTDLWAYSIADYDDWVAKGGDLKEVERGHVNVADIEPGVYEFTHHTGEKDFDHWVAGELVFAHIRKIA
jgi:hypothetical protein